jgi:uncharacterized protein (TIGR03000 family)
VIPSVIVVEEKPHKSPPKGPPPFEPKGGPGGPKGGPGWSKGGPPGGPKATPGGPKGGPDKSIEKRLDKIEHDIEIIVDALLNLQKEIKKEKGKKSKEKDEVRLDAPAKITVQLPASAELYVDDVLCPMVSGTRSFDTPALPAGQQFTYTLRVEGAGISLSKQVFIEAGQHVQVNFNGESATIASED